VENFPGRPPRRRLPITWVVYGRHGLIARPLAGLLFAKRATASMEQRDYAVGATTWHCEKSDIFLTRGNEDCTELRVVYLDQMRLELSSKDNNQVISHTLWRLLLVIISD
jgi:hypothetical protein